MENRDPREIGNMYSDAYDPSVGAPVVAAPAAVRAAFLQKVYLTFLFGLAIAMAVAFSLVNSAVKTQQVPWLMARVASNPILTLVIYVALAFAASAAARVSGINVVIYGAFTAFTGAIISPLFLVTYAQHGYGVIWNAFAITGLVFGGLTAYVLISGKDFSFMGGMLTMGLFVLIGFMIGTFFFHASGFAMGVTVGGIVLFSLFVLYDTSVIMNQLAPNEWVAGALRLFLDFINLFIRILSLLGGSRR